MKNGLPRTRCPTCKGRGEYPVYISVSERPVDIGSGSCHCNLGMVMDSTRVKALHTWLKEHNAPEEYVDSLNETITDLDEAETRVRALEDDQTSLVQKLHEAQRELGDLTKSLQDATYELDKALQLIRQIGR